MYYIEKLKDRIGKPDLIICTDSGSGNYDTFWNTTSLRGCIKATLNVKVLTEGVHSGDASGIVPSSFRIIRHILDKLEDSKTGLVHSELFVEIPPHRYIIFINKLLLSIFIFLMLILILVPMQYNNLRLFQNIK